MSISILKAIKKLFKKNHSMGQDKGDPKREIFSLSLEENLAFYEEIFQDCDDVVVRRWKFGAVHEFKAALIFVEGLADKNTINEEILKSLAIEARQAAPNKIKSKKELYDLITRSAITVADIKEMDDRYETIDYLMTGMCLFMVDGISGAIVAETKGWEHRGVEEPEVETIIRGPRDGFCETLRVNTTLVRRRIRDPNLKIKSLQIGRRTKTDVAVLYMADVTNPGLVEEVKGRLEAIDIDGILESGYIEQLIEDTWLSPFPQLQATERPDAVAHALLNGRVAILTDNTPFAMIIPTTINSLMQSPEDYYQRWFIGSFTRMIRFAANFLALILPSLYIALTSFHPEMLPTRLALSIAASREGVPFPAFLEAFIMEGAIELLREAGIRLPGPIGQTIGIVGGLIIGEAAVSASIVSSVMVIVVAVTAISSFAMPTYDVAIAFRLLRFFLMALATILGLYGVILGLMLILTHLAILKSFGVSYLAPWSPLRLKDLKDSIIRFPMMAMKDRLTFADPRDLDRMKDERDDIRPPREKRSGGKVR